ncbi:hypothetical protein TEA_023763 [Camellia sinensis var. sinensis]|uniref:Fucosyltransferase n=1 Tax=Camellia sinensis var. sinensis TaxID=542762 RepID=A0A4S4ENX6_CAMSN|nr:hypothetical protein TEA_023763 [Camellia sinensis var. sinensis]
MGGASSSNTSRKRWSNLMPLLVVLVLVADIAFLTQLDLPKNAALLADKFCQFMSSSSSSSAAAGLDRSSDGDNYEEWLERQDFVEYSRDFQKEPILVKGGDQTSVVLCLTHFTRSLQGDTLEDLNALYSGSSSFTVRVNASLVLLGVSLGYNPNKKPDAGFGLSHQPGTASVLRSMESSQYYAANNIALARRWVSTLSDDSLRGYNIVMTTSLSSDVPVGYFSWSEYDIMAPLQPKTDNFAVEKVKSLKHYKFSLAFENFNEEDYVTEKYFQSLVAAGQGGDISPTAAWGGVSWYAAGVSVRLMSSLSKTSQCGALFPGRQLDNLDELVVLASNLQSSNDLEQYA